MPKQPGSPSPTAAKGRVRQAKRDKIKFNMMVVGETGISTYDNNCIMKRIR